MILFDFLQQLWSLSLSMAPYILFGLLFAGILHELVPDTLVTKHLGKNSISSVIKSTIFGIPLPVCSCGVIPLATSIKKSGASKGATLSFLISTPITGVDSILATYGIFGWIFTIYRIVTSMVIAIIAGILTNIFDKEKEIKQPKFSLNKPDSIKSDSSCCSGESCCSSNEIKKGFSIKSALNYAFVTLLGDIAKPLFWGLVLGAIITTFMPQNLSDILKQHSWLS
ncbi:MAG: permease, partial [Sulfurospirillum sp.]